MPVEGRGLSSRPTQHVVRDLEIGQPINSDQCPEAADGVTRESEGSSRVSLLCLVRQDLSRGCAGTCVRPVSLEQGRAGCRSARLRGGRGVWGAEVARRTGACAQAGELPAGPYQKSVYPEGQWQAKATGHLDLVRSGVHD